MLEGFGGLFGLILAATIVVVCVLWVALWILVPFKINAICKDVSAIRAVVEARR